MQSEGRDLDRGAAATREEVMRAGSRWAPPCLLPCALCLVPSALCLVPSALCLVPFASLSTSKPREKFALEKSCKHEAAPGIRKIRLQ